MGRGDIAYNAYTKRLALVSVKLRVGYHLYNVDPSADKPTIELARRSRWVGDSTLIDFSFSIKDNHFIKRPH